MALPIPMTIDPEVVDADEQARIEALAMLLRQGDPATIALADGRALPLGPALRRLLEEAATILAGGESVALVPLHKSLTTQQAADLLGVSRQYLTRLLDDGAIPFQRIGTHQRVLYAEVLAYQRQRQRQRREALRELTRVSEDLGLYDRPD